MVRYCRSPWIAVPVALMLAAIVPMLVGQGCPQGPWAEPLDPGLLPTGQTVVTVGTGNIAPSLTLTHPSATLAVGRGEMVTIRWIDFDLDDNAVITLLVDPDDTFGNGNEIIVEPALFEDPEGVGDSYALDTASLPTGTYRVLGRIMDGVNPENVSAAPGQLILVAAGLVPGNVSPSIIVTEPAINIGVGHGDTVPIEWCGSDPDDGVGNVIPDVVILFDLDDDPTNDLDLSGLQGEVALTDVCTGTLPQEVVVDGVTQAFVLGCFFDDDCLDPTTPTTFPPAGTYQIDVTEIPARPGGQAYRVRATMWDHTNPPVHSYAPGGVSFTALASGAAGEIDLGDVGHTVSGSKFYGFDAGARAGFTGTDLGDFDADGADDFIIVSRFGRPFERGNVGSAFLVYGTAGRKFASEIHLNSVGTDYRGAGFAMGVTPATEGITSVTPIGDLNGDGQPEIVFGTPYVEEFYDYYDDDPEDDETMCCYGGLAAASFTDGMPNPWSTSEGNDDLGAWDFREGSCPPDAGPDDPAYICSNDFDLFRSTPINQGYVIYVRSDNPLDGSVIELRLVGQKDPDNIFTDENLYLDGDNAPNGARFRGGWYLPGEWDFTQTVHPYAIIPDNEFGRTVASMPDMTSGWLLPSRDGQDELLISAPSAFRGRGAVVLNFGQEFGSWSSQAVQSIPNGPRNGQGWPVWRGIRGSAIGDHFGYAGPAGDFNLDGNQDFLAGAPGGDRSGMNDNGIVYIFFGRLAFGDIDLAESSPPRVEIHGTMPNDRFGEMQTMVGDINQDGLPDIGLASQYADGVAGADAGFIGVVFGGRALTGENIFSVNQVGSAQLPGVRFEGSQAGAQAGAVINDAGDFNGDGIEDLLIVAPNETRIVRSQLRRGVAYVILGGRHLENQAFSLSQAGTPALPAVVFVSPYAAGTADEAPTDWIGAAGDVNSDGFDDILIGVSTADFVNPLEPSQRRIDSGECFLIYGNNTGSNTLGQ